MGVSVPFDYAGFRARYPEWAVVQPETLASYYEEAGLYLANDGTGPVGDVTQQKILMWMLTAHLAQLNQTVAGACGSVTAANQGMVGRISSVSEGSVSVSLQPLGGSSSDLAVWFQLTPYGVAYWAATARYRTMHYRPRAGRFGFRRF